jgi:aspartate-semialdehyde dehydrogenase
MVGSVLMQRMREENDFAVINEPVFFTTSNVGGKGPDIGRDVPALKDAKNIDELKAMDAIVTCQGGDYTSDISETACSWLERLLDRCGLYPAHG